MNIFKALLLTTAISLQVSGMDSDTLEAQNEENLVQTQFICASNGDEIVVPHQEPFNEPGEEEDNLELIPGQLRKHFIRASKHLPSDSPVSAIALFLMLNCAGTEVFKYLTPQGSRNCSEAIASSLPASERIGFSGALLRDLFPLFCYPLTTEWIEHAFKGQYFYGKFPPILLEEIFHPDFDLTRLNLYLGLFFQHNRQPKLRATLINLIIFRKNSPKEILETVLRHLENVSMQRECSKLFLEDFFHPSRLSNLFPQEFYVRTAPEVKKRHNAHKLDKFKGFIKLHFEENEGGVLAEKLLEVLLKTFSADLALELFFDTLKTDALKQDFVKRSLFDPFALLAFSKDKPFLNDFPRLRSQVFTRQSWLEQAIKHGDLVNYFKTLPPKEVEQKLFGFVLLLMKNGNLASERTKQDILTEFCRLMKASEQILRGGPFRNVFQDVIHSEPLQWIARRDFILSYFFPTEFTITNLGYVPQGNLNASLGFKSFIDFLFTEMQGTENAQKMLTVLLRTSSAPHALKLFLDTLTTDELKKQFVIENVLPNPYMLLALKEELALLGGFSELQTRVIKHQTWLNQALISDDMEAYFKALPDREVEQKMFGFEFLLTEVNLLKASKNMRKEVFTEFCRLMKALEGISRGEPFRRGFQTLIQSKNLQSIVPKDFMLSYFFPPEFTVTNLGYKFEKHLNASLEFKSFIDFLFAENQDTETAEKILTTLLRTTSASHALELFLGTLTTDELKKQFIEKNLLNPYMLIALKENLALLDGFSELQTRVINYQGWLNQALMSGDMEAYFKALPNTEVEQKLFGGFELLLTAPKFSQTVSKINACLLTEFCEVLQAAVTHPELLQSIEMQDWVLSYLFQPEFTVTEKNLERVSGNNSGISILFQVFVDLLFSGSQDTETAEKILTTLLKTDLAPHALKLFLGTLRTDELKKQFIEKNLLNPYMLLALKENCALLDGFPELQTRVVKYQGWLNEALISGDMEAYFKTLANTEKEQKFFGFMMILAAPDIATLTFERIAKPKLPSLLTRKRVLLELCKLFELLKAESLEEMSLKDDLERFFRKEALNPHLRNIFYGEFCVDLLHQTSRIQRLQKNLGYYKQLEGRPKGRTINMISTYHNFRDSIQFEPFIKFFFESDQDSEYAKALLDALLSTASAPQALSLFFANLKTDEARKRFVEDSLFDPYVLLAFEENPELLTQIPEGLQAQVIKHQDWLAEAIYEEAIIPHFKNLPEETEIEKERKFFGYAMLLQNKGQRISSLSNYNFLDYELCRLNLSKGIELYLLQFAQSFSLFSLSPSRGLEYISGQILNLFELDPLKGEDIFSSFIEDTKYHSEFRLKVEKFKKKLLRVTSDEFGNEEMRYRYADRNFADDY